MVSLSVVNALSLQLFLKLSHCCKDHCSDFSELIEYFPSHSNLSLIFSIVSLIARHLHVVIYLFTGMRLRYGTSTKVFISVKIYFISQLVTCFSSWSRLNNKIPFTGYNTQLKLIRNPFYIWRDPTSCMQLP